MSMTTKEFGSTSLSSPFWEGLLTGKFWLGSNSITATFDKDGNGTLNRWWFRSENYSVLETDYTDYAVIYGCENWPASWAPLIHTENSWMLARTKTPPPETDHKAFNTMRYKLPGYKVEYTWKKTIQGKKCKYIEDEIEELVEGKKQNDAEAAASGNLKREIHALRDSKAASFKDKLTDEQFNVAFHAGTERSFSGAYWDNHAEGLYKSVASGEIVFSSKDKYESHTGWPSFSKPAKAMEGKTSCITEIADRSVGILRTEIACNKDGIHLGHVFEDGPVESGGRRYCMNSAAMTFVAKADLTDAERKFYFPAKK